MGCKECAGVDFLGMCMTAILLQPLMQNSFTPYCKLSKQIVKGIYIWSCQKNGLCISVNFTMFNINTMDEITEELLH